ncbi:hypothetical protein ZWY2020_006322 [Hordeum vulgare]|nr:hypothetical protein ZWY2020_006322 [Hordeum vulgare]
MGLPNLSYTPPVEDGDEMDEDVGNEQVTKKNKTLNDQQKFATYVALHTVCMSRGGSFKGTKTQDLAIFFGVGVWNIQRIWRRAMFQIKKSEEVDVSNQKMEIVEESLRTLT